MRLSKTTRKFLAVWCCDGLETLCDLTELERQQNDWEKEAAWRILKGEQHRNKPEGPRLQSILVRARVNFQRQYEVYIYNTEGMTKEDVAQTFEEERSSWQTSSERMVQKSFLITTQIANELLNKIF